MKKIVLILLFFSCSKEIDGHKEYAKDWNSALDSLAKDKEKLKSCKNAYLDKLSDTPLMYKFEIKDGSINSIEVFADNFSMPDNFHDCVKKVLSEVKLSLDKKQHLQAGYLLLTKDNEIFKTVLY